MQHNDSLLSRLTLALELANRDPLDMGNRTGLTVNYPWASELIFSLSEERLWAAIYLGNTKAQSAHMNFDDKSWMDTPGLTIQGKVYPIQILHHIRFSSWRKYISGLWFGNEIKGGFKENKLYTNKAWKNNGFWYRKEWDKFEAWMDTFFEQEEYDWKSYCGWGGPLFHQSNRKRFSFTTGYEVVIEIPYQDLPPIGTHRNDTPEFSTYIDDIETAFRGLLD